MWKKRKTNEALLISSLTYASVRQWRWLFWLDCCLVYSTRCCPRQVVQF